MKGDFTRFTHRPEQHYTRVLKQQGRVDLDADWNEHAEIQAALDQTRGRDVIGPSGVPKGGEGFLIALSEDTAAGPDLIIRPGRLYVEGLLCVLEEEARYLDQPDYPDPPALTPEDGRTDLVYLDVWERHVTALEDPALREVALGGPDTTTRVQTVCQVKVLPGVGNGVGDGVGDVACDDDFEGWPPAQGDGLLTATATQAASEADPCTIPPAGGYRGLENRLYRVEVHDPTGSAAGATWKWSRDNGTVAFAVEELGVTGDPKKVRVKRLGLDQMLAFREGDWVEVLDDGAELRGEPGTLAQIADLDPAQRVLTLSKDASGYSLDGHPRVRRWDQASDAVPVAAGPLALEDGVQVAFPDPATKTYLTGDHWVFAARTATASIEPLTEAPARGIRHHYGRLALVTWTANGGTWQAAVEDCRHAFPPLTGLCAEDVCFDDANCDLGGATTVQEALDRLCQANDLRHHNKHLHGWGIVCGLQVRCGPDTPDDDGPRRESVTVQPGYAIDCAGNDLEVETDIVVNVLDETDPSSLDEGDNGEVCLTLERGEDQPVRVGVEPYGPKPDFWRSALDGTLLTDFYNGCIKGWVDLVRAGLVPPPPEEGALVTDAQKRFTSFLNLLWQFFDPACGRYVFLSQKEHDVLKAFYDMLRGMLQSKTFCAMFENARPFPEYLPEHGISTVFGRGALASGTLGEGLHTRLRVHPRGQYGYTCGSDNRIHVYDLTTEEMVADVEVPGGAGIVVRDVAFSEAGDRLFAIATLSGTDTIFAVADLGGVEHAWRPVGVLCDVELMTLATTRARPDLVYAVGKGRGLYAIDPENVDLGAQPTLEFDAAGHLVIADELGTVYATAKDPDGQTAGQDGVYDQVVGFGLDNGGSLLFRLEIDDQRVTGRDDIAVVADVQEPTLFVVVDPPPQGGSTKQLLCHFAPDPRLMAMVDLEDDTEIRLGHVPGSPYLLVSYEDCHRIRLMQMDARRPLLRPDFNFPVQVSPLSLAVAPDRSEVYALNYFSNTVTAIPARLLVPDPSAGVESGPGSQAFLDELEAYRNDVINAFLDLFGGFLQYLKDCFCDHLLIKCPTCDEDDKVYLACVSIRGGEVYHVCNFSRRRYVKSFPALEYWLSLVPVLPLVRSAVERFCCSILPDVFGRFQAPRRDAYQPRAKGSQMRSGAAVARSTDFRGLFDGLAARVGLAGQVTGDWAASALSTRKAPAPRATALSRRSVVGQPVEEASRQMAAAHVEVARVEAYDPARLTTNLRGAALSSERIAPGTRVVAYEQDGVVRYVAPVVEEADPIAEIRSELEAQRSALDDLGTLKATLVTRDEELVAVRGQLEALERRQPSPATEASTARIAEMEAELVELRAFREEVTAFMTRSGRKK